MIEFVVDASPLMEALLRVIKVAEGLIVFEVGGQVRWIAPCQEGALVDVSGMKNWQEMEDFG